MTGKLTVSRKFNLAREAIGRKRLREGEEAAKPAGRLQRVSRVMALTIQRDQLIRDGVIKDQSELAHYAQVTTARMTHIMWLTHLAPDIQEVILFLPRIESGPDRVKEIDVRRITRVMDWGGQRVSGSKLANSSPRPRFTQVSAVPEAEGNWPPALINSVRPTGES